MQKYVVLAYYWLGLIEDPHAEVVRHQNFLQSRDVRCRIYISEQGMNAQASGTVEAVREYLAWLKRDPRFRELEDKIHFVDEHAFPKMTVKYRRQLVAIDCAVDLSQRGETVAPRRWRQMLEERGEDTFLLDVRNNYEWRVGRFEGAELPPLETFRQFPLYARELKKKRDPQKTRIMMYCTGGIRCEFFSAVMKQEGFEKVYQLGGGVIRYGLEEGTAHWQGKLFVFDDRLVTPIDEGRTETSPIATCAICASSCDTYRNCANMDCNALFICCLDCLRARKGCCSLSCEQSGCIRPYREDGKPFCKWDFREKQAMRQSTSTGKTCLLGR